MDTAPESETTEPARLVITLVSPAAQTTRRLAATFGVRPTEVVRRGISLMKLVASLTDGEDLMVRRRDGSLDLILPWS